MHPGSEDRRGPSWAPSWSLGGSAVKSAHRGLPNPQQDDHKMACFASRASSPPFAPGSSRGPRVESSLLESSLPAQDRRSHMWGGGKKLCLVSDTLTAQSWADRGHSRKALDSFSHYSTYTFKHLLYFLRFRGDQRPSLKGLITCWRSQAGKQEVKSWREERSTPSLWGCIA